MQRKVCFLLYVDCVLILSVSQAPTVEVKTAWLGELRRILTNQQKLLKGLDVAHITLQSALRKELV